MDYSHVSLFLLIGGSFVSTNLDNLVLLMLLQKSRESWKFYTSVGFAIACGGVVSLAVAAALLGGSLDGRYVGYLGIVPFLMGVRILVSRRRNSDGTKTGPGNISADSKLNIMLTTTVMMLGNSGDSLAVLLPLFLDTLPKYYLFLLLCYALFVGLWVFVAHHVSANVSSARRVIAAGEKAVPWVMISIGIYIFLDTAADTLIRG